MTRVLVLGNSHAATLRRAFPQIAQAHPHLTLTFWGLPGGAFEKATTGPDGRLRPDPTDRVSLRKTDQWAIADSVDLGTYDHIFLVGLRYGLRTAYALMRGLQPLDWGRRDGAQGVSPGLLRAALRAEIDASLAAQAARTPYDARYTLMPAPYPAAQVLRRGTLHEPVTTAAATLARAPELMAMYEGEMLAAHAAMGVAFAPQPRATLARPLLTQDLHLEDPARDARHMNAGYGLTAFQAMVAATALIPAAFPCSAAPAVGQTTARP